MKYLTTNNSYWRLFYLYPFPLVCGISIAFFIEKMRAVSLLQRVIVFFLVSGSILYSFVYPPRFSSLTTNACIGRPSYKLDTNLLNDARAIVQYAPQGTMIAPWDLSGIIAMLDSRFPQMTMRSFNTEIFLSLQGLAYLAKHRNKAADLLSGKNEDIMNLIIVLEQDKPVSIVMAYSVSEYAGISQILKKYQYLQSKRFGEFVLFWK